MVQRKWIHRLKLAVFIIVAVWLVKAFLVASYFIPSSGMENSLYRGEGILVNKLSYGIRMPLASWLGYHRIGECQVQKGDIVLFNDPGIRPMDTPLEWRDDFIGRCMGGPGDTLMLNREWMVTDSEACSPDSKELYVYPASQEELMQEVLSATGLSENKLISYTHDGGYIRSFSHYEFYLVSQKGGEYLSLHPLNSSSSEDIHPYIVPGKGKTVKVYPWNAILLGNTILCHEKRQAYVDNDTLYVDSKPVQEYTFSKDYFWMAANDPINLADSRLFGFVPADCIIGKAWYIWFPSRWERFFRRVQ